MIASAQTNSVSPSKSESTIGKRTAARTITTTSPPAITPPVRAPRWMTGALPSPRARRAAFGERVALANSLEESAADENAPHRSQLARDGFLDGLADGFFDGLADGFLDGLADGLSDGFLKWSTS